MDNHLLINDGTSLEALHAKHGERRLAEEAKQRMEEEKKTERSKKEVSINNARPRLEDVEDRKINHPSSLAFLPTFIRTTIGRRSSLGRATSSNKRRSSNLSSFSRFLLDSTTRVPLSSSPVFFAFHGTNKERFQARAATPLTRWLIARIINGHSNNCPISGRD